MGDLNGSREAQLINTIGGGILTNDPIHTKKKSHLVHRTIRSVCASCNNGWMSALEAAAKPKLLPLITGQEVSLSTDDQLLVAQWIAMKIMVAEHDRPENVVTPECDRAAFMRDKTIPSYYEIRIGQHNETWTVAFLRKTYCLAFGDRKTAMGALTDGPVKNVQDVNFVMGKLVVSAAASRTNKTIAEMFAVNDQILPRIWPQSGVELKWPPPRSITHRHTESLASRFDDLEAANKTLWMQHPREPLNLDAILEALAARQKL